MRRSFPEVSRKFLETPVGFNLLARCYTTWLPVLEASIDPVFVVRAMDYDRLRNSPNAGRRRYPDVRRLPGQPDELCVGIRHGGDGK